MVLSAETALRLRPFTAHPRDPHAFVLAPRRITTEDDVRGVWAGKIAAHAPHHRFGSFGRLPHLQLNLWRVGVKGSGVAYRLPLAPALVVGARMFVPMLLAAVRGGF